MPLYTREDLEQLREELAALPPDCDDDTFRVHNDLALELDRHSLRSSVVKQPFVKLIDPRVEALDGPPTRMGHADVPIR